MVYNTDMQKLLSVALDVPLNKLFDYHCDDNKAMVGSRVKVPFGASTRIGLIVEIKDSGRRKNNYKIKNIYEVLDEKPILSNEDRKSVV